MKNSLFIILLLFSISLFAQENMPHLQEVHTNPDVSAQFPGGLNAFYKFLGDNFVLPEAEQDVSLKFYVSLIVNTDGTLSDINVIRDPGYGLADETIRVIKLSPAWTPAVHNNIAVKYKTTLPITVSLKAKPVISTSTSKPQVDVMPEYPGGFENFRKEVTKRLKMPTVNKDINLRLYVNFVVTEDGSLTEVKCARDPGYGIAAAAERALKEVKTRWKPALKDGVPVKYSLTLPIIISTKKAPLNPDEQPGSDMWQRRY